MKQPPRTSIYENTEKHLSFTDVVRLSLRIFVTKPLRTVLTILGIAVGIATVLFLVSLGYGLQYILIGKLVTTEDSLVTLEATYPSESSLAISYEKVDDISREQNVGEVSPVAEFPGEMKIDGTTGLVGARIVDYAYFRLAGLKPDIGSVFSESDKGVLITSQATRLIGLEPDAENVGKEVTLRVFYEDADDALYRQVEAERPLPIRGIIDDDFLPPLIFIPQEYLIESPPFFQRILVKAETIEQVEAVRDELLEDGFLISARIDLVRQARKLTNIFTIVLGVFGITALAVSFIGMLNTMIINFMERIFEVGIMKSLGATDRDIKSIFLMEAFIIGSLGGVSGVVLGIVSGELFNAGINMLAKSYGGEAFDLFITPLWFIIFVIVMSSSIGLLSGVLPAYRSTKLSPKEAFLRK
jgi:putative ABC transport system permease protein